MVSLLCRPDSRKNYHVSSHGPGRAALIVPRRSLKSRPELNPAPGPRRFGRGRLGSVHARQDGNNTCPRPDRGPWLGKSAHARPRRERTPVSDFKASEGEKWNGQTDANIHGGPRAVAWGRGRGTVPSSECCLDLPWSCRAAAPRAVMDLLRQGPPCLRLIRLCAVRDFRAVCCYGEYQLAHQ